MHRYLLSALAQGLVASAREAIEVPVQLFLKRGNEPGAGDDQVVSMDEEVRRTLDGANSPPDYLGDLTVQIFGSEHGVDLQLPVRAPHQPSDLSE